MALLTLQEVRDEGFSSARYSDQRVTDSIELVTDYVEELTGNFFEPRTLTLKLDGDRTPTLLLPYPIISITQVKDREEVIDLAGLKVYNRHLSGLRVLPDDRKNPKIEYDLDEFPYNASTFFGGGVFSRGVQNITVVGDFGYRDYDPGDATGKVPTLLKRALFLLLPRYLEQAATSEGKAAWSASVKKRTKTRSMECEEGGAIVMGNVMGSLTGNWEIDQILSKFTRPTFGVIV